jgi:uncharacterized protein (DUF305 family)
MKKLAIYALLMLITNSVLDSAKAEEQKLTQTPPSENTSPMDHNMGMNAEVDKTFIEMMIPHHRGAIEMAQMALNKAKNPEIKKLAESIVKDQNREIEQMQAWYKQWYGTSVPERNMGQGMMMSMQKGDMMNADMINTLKNTSDFDREFLRQMTRHHQTATMMAGMAVNSAKRPEIRQLAQNIIKSQSEEIAQMQRLLNVAYDHDS